MIQVSRKSFMNWLAPAFLLALAGVFFVAPWGLKGKLDAVCFGI